uniref:WRKY domain-containing protein n=1 Tax=Zea mays TaxID=4577 RepID=A0A804NJ16_MAIZE
MVDLHDLILPILDPCSRQAKHVQQLFQDISSSSSKVISFVLELADDNSKKQQASKVVKDRRKAGGKNVVESHMLLEEAKEIGKNRRSVAVSSTSHHGSKMSNAVASLLALAVVRATCRGRPPSSLLLDFPPLAPCAYHSPPAVSGRRSVVVSSMCYHGSKMSKAPSSQTKADPRAPALALSSTTNLANLLPTGVLLAFNLLALKSPFDGCVYYVVTSCTGLRLLNYLPDASPLPEGVTRRSPPQGTGTRHRIPIVANTVAKYKKSNREIDTNWNYYRCANSKDQGCPATKTVQQKETDGSGAVKLFDVDYYGQHTCNKDGVIHPYVVDTAHDSVPTVDHNQSCSTPTSSAHNNGVHGILQDDESFENLFMVPSIPEHLTDESFENLVMVSSIPEYYLADFTDVEMAEGALEVASMMISEDIWA